MLTPRTVVVAALVALGLSCSGAGSGEPGPATPRYRDLIRKDRYTRLVIEVDSVTGTEPTDAVTSRLAAGIDEFVAKPDGVEARLDGTISSLGVDHAWTFAELDALAEETFDLDAGAGAIKVHVMFLDGHYAEDEGDLVTLGLAWSSTHIALFADTLAKTCTKGASGPVGAKITEKLCEAAAVGVLLHEAGHLLGLVDNGLPMVSPHRDPDESHGAHDANESCLMYYLYEGASIVDHLRDRILAGQSSDMTLDAACKDDIAAVRDAP